MVKLLLIKNNINSASQETFYYKMLLLWIAKNKYKAMVKLLLAMDGINPDSKDIYYG